MQNESESVSTQVCSDELVDFVVPNDEYPSLKTDDPWVPRIVLRKRLSDLPRFVEVECFILIPLFYDDVAHDGFL